MNEDFSHRFSTARRLAGRSQAEIARLMGLARMSVNQWESGFARPSSEKIPAVADLLGVSVEWLMTGRGPMHRQDVIVQKADSLVVIIEEAIKAGRKTDAPEADLARIALNLYRQSIGEGKPDAQRAVVASTIDNVIAFTRST